MACERKFTCDLCGCRIDNARLGLGGKWKFNERVKSGDRIETTGFLSDAEKHVCFKCMDEICFEAERWSNHSELTFFNAAQGKEA
jgi:hypothetical protein